MDSVTTHRRTYGPFAPSVFVSALVVALARSGVEGALGARGIPAAARPWASNQTLHCRLHASGEHDVAPAR